MALLLRRALRGCLILAAVGLLLFAVVGDRRMEDFISRMRDRHEVGDENSGLSKLLRKTTTDIRPCCDATKTMSLKMFVDQSYQCEQRISVKENLYCGGVDVFARLSYYCYVTLIGLRFRQVHSSFATFKFVVAPPQRVDGQFFIISMVHVCLTSSLPNGT